MFKKDRHGRKIKRVVKADFNVLLGDGGRIYRLFLVRRKFLRLVSRCIRGAAQRVPRAFNSFENVGEFGTIPAPNCDPRAFCLNFARVGTDARSAAQSKLRLIRFAGASNAARTSA
jgi:hypothetical protein